MNRTDDEPQTETDLMATAFSTMRKHGMNILTATQCQGSIEMSVIQLN